MSIVPFPFEALRRRRWAVRGVRWTPGGLPSSRPSLSRPSPSSLPSWVLPNPAPSSRIRRWRCGTTPGRTLPTGSPPSTPSGPSRTRSSPGPTPPRPGPPPKRPASPTPSHGPPRPPYASRIPLHSPRWLPPSATSSPAAAGGRRGRGGRGGRGGGAGPTGPAPRRQEGEQGRAPLPAADAHDQVHPLKPSQRGDMSRAVLPGRPRARRASPIASLAGASITARPQPQPSLVTVRQPADRPKGTKVTCRAGGRGTCRTRDPRGGFG